MRLVLLLLSLLLGSNPPADDAGVYVYIPAPVAGQSLPATGDTWAYQVDVYATLDVETPLTLTLIPDPRLDAVAALATAGVRCDAAGIVICTGTIRRFYPASVWLIVQPRPDSAACPPLEFIAQAQAGGSSARQTHRAGARSCVYAPHIGGP